MIIRVTVISKFITAIERVSPMVDERTLSEKLVFFENKLVDISYKFKNYIIYSN